MPSKADELDVIVNRLEEILKDISPEETKACERPLERLHKLSRPSKVNRRPRRLWQSPGPNAQQKWPTSIEELIYETTPSGLAEDKASGEQELTPVAKSLVRDILQCVKDDERPDLSRLFKETHLGLKNVNEAIAGYLLRQTELASQTQGDLATLQRFFALLFMLHYNKRVTGLKSEPHRERQVKERLRVETRYQIENINKILSNGRWLFEFAKKVGLGVILLLGRNARWVNVASGSCKRWLLMCYV